MKTKITIVCYFFLLLSSIVEVDSQICDSTIPYDRCSINSACGCFPMVGTDNVGVCGFLWKSCSQFVPCGSSQECSDSDHICVHHRRCNDSPICYPLSMIKENICSPLLIVTNETTTMKLDTTTRGVKFNKWKQNGMIVAGGNGEGGELNQLSLPYAIFIDKNQNIFIADTYNNRIVQWKPNDNQGKIVAGGNGNGSRIDQLHHPSDVIVDEENNSLIIADYRNGRVIRWSLNQNQQEILIENIWCWSLRKDKYGFIYVSDEVNSEVRRWKMGEDKQSKGELVAGGYGSGDQLNQLNRPTSIFVDDEQSIYISDYQNHRVMKWRKDAREGIVVAGGNGQGNELNQFNGPGGIIVDDFGQIYVADCFNHRIMRWREESQEGEIIVGGNENENRFSCPSGLSFDIEGNLYATDFWNNQIQKFDLIS